MPFSATVLNVLIASPSDVSAERDAIAQSLYDWNALNSAETGYVLLPVRWESHSAPAMGDRPQGIINNQVVRGCDLLIGAFWTRLGSPTGVEDSGTVEEIRYFLKNSRPVMLYFSSALADPNTIDLPQLQKLKDFRSSIKNQGIQNEYNSISSLKEQLSRHLTIVMRDLNVKTTVTSKIKDEIIADDALKNQPAQAIELKNYSDKAFIVVGNTMDIKDKLKEAGGKWTRTKSGTFAWMFSKRRLTEVAAIVQLPPALN